MAQEASQKASAPAPQQGQNQVHTQVVPGTSQPSNIVQPVQSQPTPQPVQPKQQVVQQAQSATPASLQVLVKPAVQDQSAQSQSAVQPEKIVVSVQAEPLAEENSHQAADDSGLQPAPPGM